MGGPGQQTGLVLVPSLGSHPARGTLGESRQCDQVLNRFGGSGILPFRGPKTAHGLGNELLIPESFGAARERSSTPKTVKHPWPERVRLDRSCSGAGLAGRSTWRGGQLQLQRALLVTGRRCGVGFEIADKRGEVRIERCVCEAECRFAKPVVERRHPGFAEV